MKRLAAVLAALVFLSSAAYAQDRYYYSDERKIPIEKSESWKVVQTAPGAGPSLTRAMASRSDLRLRKALDTERGFYWLAASGGQALDAAALDGLASQVQIERSFPVFFRLEPRGDTTRFAMTDEFRVQFEEGVTRAEIDEINAKYGVEIFLKDARDEQQARDYNEYLLRVTETSSLSTLEVANSYYESALTKWSLPNFHTNYRSDSHRASGARRAAPQRTAVNDPLYDEQYYLNNTSNNLGTSDVDIDAPEAWNLTKSSSSIMVAIFDDGTEQHEDFYSGQVVSGYTAGGGDGSPGPDSDHGQAVAGIIAANHNTKGIRGVAPNVKIMPVRILGVGASPNEVENVIDDAWQNGADVLSNSWGGPEDDGIEAAFVRARENGRNGKGSVIVKSAGNRGHLNNEVTFPATVPGMLVVGAVDKNDNKWYYSPEDNEVNIVAPSGDIRGDGDVRTTDRMRSSGYEPDATACDETDDADEPENYYGCFGGTSAAAPQAAGVAALMLSVNGGLSESEIRAKIEATADDYGTTSWDGEGRLDARNSVEEAYPPLNAQIYSGPMKVTEDETATWEASVSGGSGSFSIDWYKQRESGGPWLGACGTNLSCTTSFADDNDQTTDDGGIRVTVIDEATGSSDMDERPVTIYEDGDDDGGSGGGGGGCNAESSNKICESAEKKAGALGGRALPDTLQIGTVAPSPVRSRARLPVALPEAEEVRVTLYNTVGQVVERRVVSRSAGRYEVPIDVTGLSSGLYFARVTVGAVTKTRRIVVVR